jgi:hypothetical protein
MKCFATDEAPQRPQLVFRRTRSGDGRPRRFARTRLRQAEEFRRAAERKGGPVAAPSAEYGEMGGLR